MSSMFFDDGKCYKERLWSIKSQKDLRTGAAERAIRTHHAFLLETIKPVTTRSQVARGESGN